MLFISPPFGNYINLDNAMAIKGSYTLSCFYLLAKSNGVIFSLFSAVTSAPAFSNNFAIASSPALLAKSNGVIFLLFTAFIRSV